MYEVIKINIKTNEETNCGTYNEQDMKAIIKGYKFNGFFYEKSNSNTMYIVNEK